MLVIFQLFSPAASDLRQLTLSETGIFYSRTAFFFASRRIRTLTSRKEWLIFLYRPLLSAGQRFWPVAKPELSAVLPISVTSFISSLFSPHLHILGN
jgi:hypothetical protein